MPKFTILSRVDAYIDYTCEVEAADLRKLSISPTTATPPSNGNNRAWSSLAPAM